MGLASYFETKGDKGIVIFAGKGGLGKTTCSAGLSHYMASKRKRNVLCFSTDPQASLSDIFDRDIFGKGLVSVIPPYYSLKILPYAVPNIKSWKQRVFRERDFTDQVF